MNSDTLTTVRSTIADFGKTVRRGRLAATVLGAALLTFSVMPHSASAAIFLCRTDPVVQLSDGTTIQLQAAISDDQADVQQIAYTVHAPAGTTLSRVVYTGGAFAAKEPVRFFADDTPGTFDTSTVVTTGTPGVAVNVQTSVPGIGRASATGQSGDTLTVHIDGTQPNAVPAHGGRD